MKKLFFKTSFIILAFVVVEVGIAAERVKVKDPSSNKALSISDIWLDANRMNGVFRNNGIWYHNATIQDWGLEWPNGSGLSPVFAAGQLIAAKVNGEIKVAGIQHANSEFQPGEIFSPFVPSDPNWGWPIVTSFIVNTEGYILVTTSLGIYRSVEPITSSEDIALNLPVSFSLEQNYPNPFNPGTTIEFGLPKTEFVSLKVYDILGKELATLVSKHLTLENYK